MTPLLTPDTSEAQDFTTPIEPNTYPSRIRTAEGGKSKTGNPKLVVKVDLTVDGKKRTRVAHLPITGEGAFGFDQLLRAVKMDDLANAYRDPNVSPKPGFDPTILTGCELMVVIGPNLYHNEATGKDEMRDQIEGWLRA